jgi:hypothetical protein
MSAEDRPRQARWRSFTSAFVLLWLAAAGAQAGPCDQCPGCTPAACTPMGCAPMNCSARDLCRAACTAPTPPPPADVFQELVAQAQKRLKDDEALATARQSLSTAQQAARDTADRHAAAAGKALAERVEAAASSARESAAARLGERVAALAGLAARLPAQLGEARQCAGAPLSSSVARAYADAHGWLKGRVGKLESQQRLTIAEVKAAADATADTGTAFSSRVADAFDGIDPHAALEAEVARLGKLMAELPANEESASRLRDWARDGFGNWQGFIDSGSVVVSDALEAARRAVDAEAAQLAAARDATLEATLRGIEQRAQDMADSARLEKLRIEVKTLAELPFKALSLEGNDRQTRCLCRHLDLLPMDLQPSDSPMAMLANRRKALCIAQMAERLPAVAPASAAVFAPTTPTNTALKGNVHGVISIDGHRPENMDLAARSPAFTNFDPDAALSTDGLRELREKADRYEAVLDQLHFNAFLVNECALTDRSSQDQFAFRGLCGDDANTGQVSGKLLAARAYKYSALKAQGDPQAEAALNRLYASLAGIVNIMSMASGQSGRITRVNGRATEDFLPGGGGPAVAGVPGLPVRGYAPVPESPRTAFRPLPNMPCAIAGRGGRSQLSTQRFSGHVYHAIGEIRADGTRDTRASALHYNFEGCILDARHEWVPGRFRFKERESGDDTPATLLGLAAAYDALKRWQHNDPLAIRWRQTIVSAAEAFGLYWVRDGHTFMFKSLADPEKGTPYGDHRMNRGEIEFTPRVLFNLAVLRVPLYLSDDHWGQPRPAHAPGIERIRSEYLKTWSLLGEATRVAGTYSLVAHAPAISRLTLSVLEQAFSMELGGLNSHLLSEYETDPRRRCELRNRLHRDIRPLMADWRRPLLDYIFVLNAEREPTCKSFDPDPVMPAVSDRRNEPSVRPPVRRDAILAQAAAILRQHRKRPAPFDNPMPESDDPTQEGFWYTDFGHYAALVDPVYRALGTIINDPKGDQDTRLSGDQGSVYMLGPGLVPKPVESGPFALVGGEWQPSDPDTPMFGLPQVFDPNNRQLVKVPSPQDYLVAYWFGRAHGLLAP